MPSGKSLWELIENRVDSTPDAMMAVDGDMRVITFVEFCHEAELAAAGFIAAGVSRGDVVAWQLPSTIESMVLVAALSRIGAVQCPLLPGLPFQQVIDVTVAVGSHLLVVSPGDGTQDIESVAVDAALENPGLRVLVLDGALPQGDVTTLPQLPDRWSAESATSDDGLVRPTEWIFHTDDPVARRGLVRHDDRSLSSAAAGMARRLGLINRDCNALRSPISGIHGILWIFASLEHGCGNVLVDTDDSADAIEVFSREGVTLITSDSSFRQMCVAAQRHALVQIFPDVRGFVDVGPPASPELFRSVSDMFEVPTLSGYGQVEAPLVVMADLSDDDAKLSSTAGCAQHGMDVRVVDKHGVVVPDGIEGELRIRGTHMMLGYHDPADDSDAFDEDGLYRTGDLGVMDADGYVTVTGHLDLGRMDRGIGDGLVIDVSDHTYRLN